MQHIIKNNLYNPTFTLTNCNGSPMDLSTSTIKFVLKANKEDSKYLLSAEYVNSNTNIVQFEFNATQTAGLPTGRAIGALKIYRDGDKNEEIWSDEYTITDGVFND